MDGCQSTGSLALFPPPPHTVALEKGPAEKLEPESWSRKLLWTSEAASTCQALGFLELVVVSSSSGRSRSRSSSSSLHLQID